MCDCGSGGGGVEMYCGPYSAGVLHSVSDQVRNLQNCFTTPNKMTNEDDIKGLVSLSSFVHGGNMKNAKNRSQTHECGNWDGGRAIPFLGIFVSNFLYSIVSLQTDRTNDTGKDVLRLMRMF
jgi:hypothetical protein